VLARRRRGLEPDAELTARYHPPRPAWTGTMAEAGGLTHFEDPAGQPEVKPAGQPEGEPVLGSQQ